MPDPSQAYAATVENEHEFERYCGLLRAAILATPMKGPGTVSLVAQALATVAGECLAPFPRADRGPLVEQLQHLLMSVAMEDGA